MLELTNSASDRAEGIRHALAAASLFETLRDQLEPHPDWLPVLEEQCCRHGAIWIHDWISQGKDLDPQWLESGLQLLDRMQAHHSEPIEWAATMADSMRRRQSAPAQHDARPTQRLVVVGSLQVQLLSADLQQALPDASIHCCLPASLADQADLRRLEEQLRQADGLIAQPVPAGSRGGIHLDIPTLAGLLPSGASSVVLPNVHYQGHHPWLGFAEDPDGRLAALEAEAPLGPYHDFLAMAAANRSLTAALLLTPSAPEPLLEILRQEHQASLLQLRQEEKNCTLTISDWIAESYRHQPITHAIDQLTQACLDQLLQRLLTSIGPSDRSGGQRFDARTQLDVISVPIHPWVRQALALGPWTTSWGQRHGSPLLIEAQLDACLAFYRKYPWIAATNADHPKLRLANACLDLLLEPPPMVEVLHLHGFKCAGTTFIGSLEHATEGQLAYLETPKTNQRLSWQQALQHLGTLPVQPRAITSHLITLPPPGALARLKVAFLRNPLARLASAYRFQLHVQLNLETMSFADYLEQVSRGLLANYQTRHLSPQDPEDWEQRQGWAARPEAIDLQRPDLFVGLVERYDDSIVALEYQLELLDCPLNLAYPNRLNTTGAYQSDSDTRIRAPRERLLQTTELDANLYRRAAERLQERLAAVPNLAARRDHFRKRCELLRQQPSPHTIKPAASWTQLSPAEAG